MDHMHTYIRIVSLTYTLIEAAFIYRTIYAVQLTYLKWSAAQTNKLTQCTTISAHVIIYLYLTFINYFIIVIDNNKGGVYITHYHIGITDINYCELIEVHRLNYIIIL